MIYLDHNATTPVDPRVLEAMTPFFTEQFGNPASRHHALGCDAAKTIERARAQVASVIGADPREIVWTSGGDRVRQPRAPGRGPVSGLPQDAHRDRRHRTPRGARHVRGARAAGVHRHLPRCRCRGLSRPGSAGDDDHGPDTDGLGHACQQRDRCAPPACRHRRALHEAWGPVSHRCDPVLRQGTDRRAGDENRPAERERPQAARAQGRRPAVYPSAGSPCALRGAAARGRTRTGSQIRHAERAGYRRHGHCRHAAAGRQGAGLAGPSGKRGFSPAWTGFR